MKARVQKAFWTSLIGLIVYLCAASAGAQIQVTSANPNNATQSTVNLNVVVNGSGFKKGAKAQWFISGTTTPGGVTVNSTTFNTSGQLTANITVAGDAYVGQFDILVTNTDGRSGKGTELFAVNKKVTITCAPDVTLQPVKLNICTTSGCLDPSFGGGTGMVTTQAYAPPYGEGINALAVQSDNKVVAAGVADGWAVVRYNSDGTLDTSFAGSGIGHYTTGEIADAALQGDGRIVAAGKLGLYQVQIARFNSDGTPDPTFGTGGYVALPQPNRKYVPPTSMSLAIQADGRILVLASLGGPWQLMRLLPSGAYDTTFASSGVLTFDPTSTTVKSVTLQLLGTEQRILVAGSLNGHTSVWRYLPSGQPDSSFGYGGIGVASTTFCPNSDYANNVNFDSSGNLLVSGTVQLGPDTAPDYAIGLSRFTPNGILDTSFGNTGKISYGIAPLDSTDGIGNPNSIIDTLGRSTFWGSGGSSSNPWPIVLRVNQDGTLDSSFPNGRLENFPYEPNLGLAHMVTQQPDGKLLFGGTISGSLAQFWTMRLIP